MTGHPPVSEELLHAYVDNLLDEAERQRVETFLGENPEAAEMVADWQSQNDGLRAAFADYEKSTSADLQMIAPKGRKASRSRAGRLSLAAASIAIFALGVLGGHYGPALFEKPEPLQVYADALPQEAHNAFLVYASEVRHPVEVFADQEAHLAAWLGKRLSIPDLKVPNLQSLGFRLVGGRLLPVVGAAGAMFMYEDTSGQRLTVIVGRNPQNQSTSFRFASAGDVETFYWIDGDLGYAVTGEISRATLQKVAEECYRQFPS